MIAAIAEPGVLLSTFLDVCTVAISHGINLGIWIVSLSCFVISWLWFLIPCFQCAILLLFIYQLIVLLVPPPRENTGVPGNRCYHIFRTGLHPGKYVKRATKISLQILLEAARCIWKAVVYVVKESRQHAARQHILTLSIPSAYLDCASITSLLNIPQLAVVPFYWLFHKATIRYILFDHPLPKLLNIHVVYDPKLRLYFTCWAIQAVRRDSEKDVAVSYLNTEVHTSRSILRQVCARMTALKEIPATNSENETTSTSCSIPTSDYAINLMSYIQHSCYWNRRSYNGRIPALKSKVEDSIFRATTHLTQHWRSIARRDISNFINDCSLPPEIAALVLDFLAPQNSEDWSRSLLSKASPMTNDSTIKLLTAAA